MKRAVLVLTAALLILSLSACGVIREKVAGAVRSAVASITLEPAATIDAETQEPEESAAPEDTATAGESAAAEETTPPEDNSSAEGYWPEGVPTFVPKFSYGAYVEKDSGKLEANESAIYTMNFTNVKKEDIDAYTEALKNAGFADATKTEFNGDMMLAANYKKDKVESSVLITLNSKENTCIFLLTVITKK